MSNSNSIWTTLIRLGLLDPVAATRLAQAAAGQIATRDAADDPAALVKYLLVQGVLTKFQAKRVLARRAGELRQGEYLVLDRIEQPPLSRWLRARHLPSGAAALIYRCSAAADATSYVDPAWLRPHVAVAADGLQPLEVVQLSGASGKDDASWRGLVVSALPEGQTLAQWLSNTGAMDPLSVIALGRVLGGALAALHAASLFHGGLRPGRVWIGNDGAVYLLRCGGGPPIYPGDSVPPDHDWFDEDGQAAEFASPQWLRGDTYADAQSDVYSLGAVIYSALTGKGISAGILPAEVAQAVAAGASGDPLLRVLAAALAADIAHRFADVAGLLRALEAAGEILAGRTPATAATSESGSVKAEPKATLPQSTVVTAAQSPAARASVEQTLRPVPSSAEPSFGTASPPLSQAAAVVSGRRIRKRTRRSRRGPIIIGAVAAAILLLLVAILLRPTQRDTAQRTRPTPRPTIPPLESPSSTSPDELAEVNTAAGSRGSGAAAPSGSDPAAVVGYELVRDDRALWVPPWSADTPPPPLERVTPGAQVIVALRPREMLRSDSGANWLAWFGPELGPTLNALQQRTGVPPQQIERLVIGLLAGRDGEPVASLAVRISQPVELKTLRQQWGATASRTTEGQTIFTGDEPDADAYYVAGDSVTDSTAVSAFALGTLEHMRLVAEGGGGPIPLPRAMQMAWDQSSDQADLVALVSPNFLFADGRKLLQRFAPRAIEPLRDLLIPDVTAALVMMDTRAAWYGEVRLVPGGNSSVASLVRVMQERAAELPAVGESFVVQSDVAPSWRALAIRLPQYLRAVNEQTRYGISQSLPTANFYLPAEAAPQVSLASLLALSTSASAADAIVAARAPQPQTLSIDQMLDTKLSISFDQESLEFAVLMIGDEFADTLPEGAARPQITIIGGDLEKSGITQNQQIRDFQMRDVPLRNVLTRLVVGANPDKTAASPADAKQSLVWVVDPAASPQAPSLLITTRPQAEAKGYQLPREFIAG